jgi:hypothetical protein
VSARAAKSVRWRARTGAGVLAAIALAVLAPAGPRAADEKPPGPVHEDARLAPVPWTIPPPGSCAPSGGLRGLPLGEEAPQAPFQPGEVFTLDKLEVLHDYLPAFLWEQRERFFFEGMRLEIGSCFADYGPPAFYQEATAEYAGEPRLTPEGGLERYTAGLPFPPDRIAPDDPGAGARWAWNFELRYQGAGFRGGFRTSDMVGREGRAEPFVGEIFKHQTAFRADRPGYQAPGAQSKHWVAGGIFFEPFDARHHAWRQYRDVAHLDEPDRSDDLHVYLPDYRRTRRVPAAGIEGLYMPSFSVGVMKPQVLAGATDVGGGGGIGAVSAPPAAITTKRSGFEGLELRPLLHELRVLGVQDVLTPINAKTPAFPADAERDFGPWGLSFASDRWDLRRALVIEGRARAERGGDQVARRVLYADLQTLAPLYYASWDARGEAIDVGMFVGRWSEERAGYPRWPDDPARPIRVVDPAGASFAHVAQGGGWRRESWEMVSTPPVDDEVRRLLSVKELTKRR